MLLKTGRFIVIFAFFVARSTVVNAQDGTGDTSDQDSETVEDATLDGAGESDASAANSTNPTNPTEKPVADVKTEVPSQVEAQAVEKPVENPRSTEEEADTKTVKALEQEGVSEATRQAESPDQPAQVVHASETDHPKEVTNVIETSKVKGTYGGRIFGKYKVQLAVNNPSFSDSQKCYDKLYGKPQSYISFAGDWFPADWWVNPGLTMRLGMYSVRGKAAAGKISADALNCETLAVDESSRTTLLFVPLQIGPKIQFSPFRKKWLVADLWMAAEYGWWQETRDSGTAMIRPIATTATDRVYTNVGHKNAVSTGFAAHILLNALEEKAVRSMIDTMGIGYVYLTGFMENVKSTSKDGLTFSRSVMGVGFTFESFK
jgi:hypothetical protein